MKNRTIPDNFNCKSLLKNHRASDTMSCWVIRVIPKTIIWLGISIQVLLRLKAWKRAKWSPFTPSTMFLWLYRSLQEDILPQVVVINRRRDEIICISRYWVTLVKQWKRLRCMGSLGSNGCSIKSFRAGMRILGEKSASILYKISLPALLAH